MTDTQRLDFIIAHDYEIVPRKGLWNILQMDEGGMSQTAINTHPDLRTAIDQLGEMEPPSLECVNCKKQLAHKDAYDYCGRPHCSECCCAENDFDASNS